MNNPIKPLLVTALASAALTLPFGSTALALDLSEVPAGRYAVDPTHGYIHLTYQHLGFSNPMLRYTDFNVALDLDTEDFTKSSLSVEIDANSIDSGVALFDEHLNGDDFFDTEVHPKITFVAKRIEQQPTSDQAINVVGDLTIKGVTKEVLLGGRVNKAGPHPFRKTPTVGVSLRAVLKRSDFDLGKYAPAVGDQVTVIMELELQKQ